MLTFSHFCHSIPNPVMHSKFHFVKERKVKVKSIARVIKFEQGPSISVQKLHTLVLLSQMSLELHTYLEPLQDSVLVGRESQT